MEKLRQLINVAFKKHRKLVFVAIILLILGFWGWRTFISPRTQQPQYQTAQVERETIVSSISASGQILSSNVMNVTTGTSGIVKQVFVSNGDKVTKGDKIAEIELDSAGQQRNASAWSSYLSAKNSLEAAQAKINSFQAAAFKANQTFINDAVARSLTTNDPTYIQENALWLQAEADYKNQGNVITQAQATLNNAWLSYQQSSPTITSPAFSIVENITIAPGMIIGAQSITSTNGQTTSSQTIAVIRSEGNPLASFNFSEIDVTKIKIGQKTTVTVDALSGKTFTGKVVAMDKIGQVVSNVTNYPVLIQLDTNSEDLLPNMAASASVIIETKDNALFVPSQAVQTENNQTTVRVVKRGQIESVPVEVGITGDQGVEIIPASPNRGESGVSEGDEVVVGTVATGQQRGTSSFGGFGSFGGGALRPGGFGGGSRGGGGMQQR
ncbi:hypothetical protein A3C26_03985 [Candidatus Daviesbacteria bacterium RIFCSPHIGHO2_02_FULL_39_12]|uniref:YknX-like beta-barrel domain-containing protein n=1 Tax=Candidatus Daviesbacteria bacterium RIFCSPHIGHO2_02_FULL_39_12 TaxID=1797770 RepID=A0A1F5J9H5_9BACT|nr:MAG: hypothetical protein A3C26_03985 [Candidatus Daviesbacteria bacterium RIFCSPHIGHO2_02_FULL_39_12]